MASLPRVLRRGRSRSAPSPHAQRGPVASPLLRVKEADGRRSFASSARLGSVDSLKVAPEWIKDTKTIPQELASDSFQLRALSRRLWTNIPMVRSWVDSVMGNTLEPRFPDLEWSDDAPSALVDQLRKVWTEFLINPVAGGGLTGAEFCKSLLRQTMIDGDIFWTTSVVAGKLYFHPIEADLVDGSHINTSAISSIHAFLERGRGRQPNPVVGGIGFSKETGQPDRYYFARPIKQTLPASEVVHVRRHLVVGWPRGVPWAKVAFNTLVRLETFAGAEMERQINSALLYFYTTSETGKFTPPSGGFGKKDASNTLPGPTSTVAGEVTSESNPALVLRRNSITQLDAKTELKTLNELGNKISPVPYIRILQTDAASALGLSLPLLLRDYNNTNFSSGRLAGESDKLYFQATRDWIRTDIFLPILQALYEHNMASRGIVAPDGVLPEEVRLLLRPTVRWPSWPTTEPHREIPALGVANKAGALSLQGWISRIDPHARVEDVFSQIAKERELARQYNIEDIVGVFAEKLTEMADRQVAESAAEDAADNRREPEGTGQNAQNPPSTGS